MKETWDKKWSHLENWSKKRRLLFWILFPILFSSIIFLIPYYLYSAPQQSEYPLSFLILIWVLAYLGSLGLTIQIGGTHKASKLTKEGSKKQKSAALAISISIVLTFVWLLLFSIYTTQTDYSTVDEILIEVGWIEDKSHLLYIPSWLVLSILMVSLVIQSTILYLVIEKPKKLRKMSMTIEDEIDEFLKKVKPYEPK